MLSFKKLTIDDIETIRPFFEFSRSNNCDNTVGGSVMWADFFNTYYYIIDKTIIFKVNFFEHGECFTVPIGLSVNNALKKICEYCKSKNFPMQFIATTDRDLACLETKFDVEKTVLPDWSDYVYYASDLIKLSGRKYHGQKNHINYFKKNFPNYTFEDINENNINEVKEFLIEFSKTESKDSILFDEELKKTKEVLENNNKYKFFGVLLKVDGEICAFSMGEIVRHTLFAHIEKADKSKRGAYPMIMNEFAKRFGENVKYINREENAGDKGLEISKLQYHPCTILNKYFAIVNCKRCDEV